jgi:hypothetical protein
MKLLSLSRIFEGAKDTFTRFPFVILSSAVGALAMIWVIQLEGDTVKTNLHVLYNVAMVASLGIPFLFSLAMFAESRNFKEKFNLLMQICGAGLLIVYYFTLSPAEDFNDIVRYFLFSFAFHLLAAFSPFLGKKNSIPFWDFNQKIFLRFLIAGLYSGVLYAGLSIALLSFDKLFDVGVNPNRYPQLFFFLAGIFNPWFFLSGIQGHADIKQSEEKFSYPKGLKIFTQYVLLPIVVVYLVILYMYLGKIILQWNLPMGWVSYLVIGFSTAGIFSLLLIYPLKDIIENKWIKIFSRSFYLSLLPLIVLLFLAIFKRTGEYGITERRYFVIVLAFWLSAITVYFIFNKFRNIKIIPVSLCLIAILTSFGPWSAFSVSQRSQIARLEEILVNNKMLVDGKIVKAKEELPADETKDVYSIVDFLYQRKKLNLIQPWFTQNIDSAVNIRSGIADMKEGSWSEAKQATDFIFSIMGIESQVKNQKEKFFSYLSKNQDLYDIKGYDYMFRFKTAVPEPTERLFKAGETDLIIRLDSLKNLISVLSASDSLTFELAKTINNLNASDSSSNNNKVIVMENKSGKLEVRMIIESVYGTRKEGVLKTGSLNAVFLIKF